MTQLTVFTPTFNRARTLSRLFESLVRQGDADFEWVVVDDGSTDDTRSVVTAWVEQAPFAIRYLRQTNRGKHAATNTGVQAARGDLFWTVDSDDWLPDQVIARMLELWAKVTQNGRPDVAALTGLCVAPNGKVIGDRFPRDLMESNSLEMSMVHRVRGDKAGWTKTDVLKAHPFPEGEHDFIPEGIVWNAIAQSYLTVYVNEPFLVKDYQEDGFTRGGATITTRGMAAYHLSLLNEAEHYLAKNLGALVRSAVLYARFSRDADVPWTTLLCRLRRARMQFVVLALSPIGWWLRRRDRRRVAP